VARVQAVILVLKEMEELDQQIALPRPLAEESLNLRQGLWLDLPAARLVTPAPPSRAGMDLARRLLSRLGHC
jgi:hypothetical protein